MYDDPACRSMSSEFCDVYRATVRGETALDTVEGDVTSPEPVSGWSYTAEPVLAT
jgi:hypothetical protein